MNKTERVRVLFDNHHPKHYLTVRQLANRCETNGIDIIWTARDKDVLVELMRADGLQPYVFTTAQKGLINLLGELLVYDWKLYRLARRIRPMALLGKNISVSHVGWLTGIPSVVINDDPAKANPQYPRLAYPFATRIVTPDYLDEDYGDKHVTYSGLCELAYLGPKNFEPDPAVRTELGLSENDRFFLIRTVALQASHDIGAKGLEKDFIAEIIRRLTPIGRVFISAEGDISSEYSELRLRLDPSRIHHVLAAADLLICDSQTMAAEAAVLGTPSLRMNNFVGRIPYLELLETKFELTYGFSPGKKAELLARLEDLLYDTSLQDTWLRRRDMMLQQWSDPTDIFWQELQRVMSS